MWRKGYRYDVFTSKPQYINQNCTRARVKVKIRDNYTSRVIERMGMGRQIGNFFPFWVTLRGKRIDLEKILKEQSKDLF